MSTFRPFVLGSTAVSIILWISYNGCSAIYSFVSFTRIILLVNSVKYDWSCTWPCARLPNILGSAAIIPLTLNVRSTWVEWSYSRTFALLLVRVLVVVWSRGWVGSRAGMNISEKRSWFTPYLESNSGFSTLHPIS